MKAYATRTVAEYQANLDALSDLARAKKIDLDATSVQNDPLLRAQRDASKDEIDRLRTLTGQSFDGAYMTAQWPMQSLLVHLAQRGTSGVARHRHGERAADRGAAGQGPGHQGDLHHAEGVRRRAARGGAGGAG